MMKAALLPVALFLSVSCVGSGSHTSGVGTPQSVNASSSEALYRPDGTVHELDSAELYSPDMHVPNVTVLYFNAVWNGPCRQLKPVVSRLAAEYAGRVTFVSIDVDTYNDILPKYNIDADIPVALLLKPDGATVSYTGTADLLPEDKFTAIIDAALQ